MLRFLIKNSWKFAWGHKKASLVALLFVGLGISYVYIQLTREPEASVVVDPKKTYADILPQQSTHDDIIQTLGVPQKVYDEGEYTVYAYPSTTSYYMPDLLYLKNDVLVMKELHYTPLQFVYTKEKLTTERGKPEKVLYIPGNAYLNHEVFIYEKAGLAAYVNAEGNVYKLRYFWPNTAEAYVQTWDLTLVKSKPKPVEEPHE